METLIAVWDFMGFEHFPAWFMTWHWGWQVFFGFMVLGLVRGTYEYFSQRTMAQVGEDIAVACLNALSSVLNGIASILAIATPIIFLIMLVHYASEGGLI